MFAVLGVLRTAALQIKFEIQQIVLCKQNFNSKQKVLQLENSLQDAPNVNVRSAFEYAGSEPLTPVLLQIEKNVGKSSS
jgi:hypothetical protein